jgi:glycosyltransferase involved in cell wall biosynthesis
MLISVVIPAYNEEVLIADLIHRVAATDLAPHRMEIIVVNDGSTDGTAAVLRSLAAEIPGIQVIHLPANRGKSCALQAGFAASRGEIVLIQDADLEYSPAEYPQLIAPFENTDVQVVYGSRFLHKTWPDNMKLHNWLANRFFTLLVNLLFKSGITDEGTAYKAFRSSLLRSIPLQTSGFAFCAEITCRLGERGVPIREVPVSYRARSVREGKKPRFYDGVAIVVTIVGIRVRTLLKKRPNDRH